jgi:hypothetical protein
MSNKKDKEIKARLKVTSSDADPGFFPFRIQGVEKQHRIPDPQHWLSEF